MRYDYTLLDARLIEAIREGHNTQSKLAAELGHATKMFQTKDRCAMRVIDCRLQALRKAGKIKYGRNDWEVAK